jgi:MerR, DNA binding
VPRSPRQDAAGSSAPAFVPSRLTQVGALAGDWVDPRSRQQHRGGVEDQRGVTGHRQHRRVPRRRIQGDEHRCVRRVPDRTGRAPRRLTMPGAQPLRHKQDGRGEADQPERPCTWVQAARDMAERDVGAGQRSRVGRPAVRSSASPPNRRLRLLSAWGPYRGTRSTPFVLNSVPWYRVDAGRHANARVGRAGRREHPDAALLRATRNPARSAPLTGRVPGLSRHRGRGAAVRQRAQELGFTLADVEGLLELAEGGPESCDAARQLAESHIAELARKIAELQRMRASLTSLVDTCQRPRADRSCPLLAAIERDVALLEVSP